ncbi:glycosyltransferase family 4 protein [Capnocytophaga gingivalis]|uniref:glycosyltransferase family 4 protein n=1 Tax=Capnocytophaga gingivalis TaxID=1017 RepID=UPI0028E70112|nr:glycosyltransferase family 4 protein [Capnocytophaga gingivalis]
MKKIKVLMFGWEFPPHISGGLGTACLGLTKGLAKNEVEVLFVMPKASGDEDAQAARIINASEEEMLEDYSLSQDYVEHIKFMEIGSTLRPYLSPEVFASYWEEERTKIQTQEHLNKRLYNFSGKYGENLLEEVYRYALVAGTIASKYDFDIIHAHDWLTYQAGILAKRISGKPLVVHVHATEYDRGGEYNRNSIVYEIEKSGMHQADHVITVSDWTRAIVIEKYGVAPEKVSTVHNAVDFSDEQLDLPPRALNEKIVTFLGRITLQKGPEYFIEAAAKVHKRLPDVHFVMAGNGDKMTPSVRRVAQLKLGGHFHFTGFLRGTDVQRMFRYSDVYVMPSVSEPFGISPLEAMRIGVPTIISKQSGVSEVLQHAIKVDYWDVDALADAIYGVLVYPKLAQSLQKEGLTEVNALKWEGAAGKLKSIYQTMIA